MTSLSDILKDWIGEDEELQLPNPNFDNYKAVERLVGRNQNREQLRANIPDLVAEIEKQILPVSPITRLEVIDHTETGTGRDYVKWTREKFVVKSEQQDMGRTLKIFISEVKENL